MRVLFVVSGKADGKLSPITSNQADSLRQIGLKIDFFVINEKGLKGYLRNLLPLKLKLKRNYNIVHAHYSFSGMLASLAGANPLVVSLMGSDVKAKKFYRLLLWFFSFLFWKKIIVKSSEMQKILGAIPSVVVPNGVDTETFKPLSQNECIKKLKWNNDKLHILFAANPLRHEKNFELAQKAVSLLNNENIELHTLIDVPHDDMVFYYNAASVVLLTSLWEGSPNVIKEAMACCRPVVSTDVGDIRRLFGDTPGCYLTSFEAKDVAVKLNDAILFSKTHSVTQGSERIDELEIDSVHIAKKLLTVYSCVFESL